MFCTFFKLPTFHLTSDFEPYLHGLRLDIGYCQQRSISPDGGGGEDGHHLFGDFAAIQASSPGEHPISSGISFTIAVLLLSITLLSCLLATAFQLLFPVQIRPNASPEKMTTLAKVVASLDVVGNVRTLFEPESNFPPPKGTENTSLPFLNGIKCLFTLCNLFVHSFGNLLLVFILPMSFFSAYPSFYQRTVMKPFGPFGIFSIQPHSPIALQAFFILSGFINTYVHLVKRKRQPTSFLLFARDKYLTFAPSVAATLCLTVLFQRLGSGPLFHPAITDTYVRPCTAYWWTHLAMINNFWNFDQMVMGFRSFDHFGT